MIEKFYNLIREIDSDDSGFKKKFYELFESDNVKELTKQLNDYIRKNKIKGRVLYPGKIELFKAFFLFINDINNRIFAVTDEQIVTPFKFRRIVSTKLFLRSIRTSLDLISLIENGSSIGMLILWRSIYNDYVIAKFILSNEESTSESYLRFSSNQLAKLLSSEPAISKVISDELIKKIQKNDYAWTGLKEKSFKGIVESIKEDKYYGHYQIASMYHHGSPFSVNHPLFQDEELDSTNSIAFLQKGIGYPHNLIVSTLADFTELMIDVFLSNDEKELLIAFTKIFAGKLDIDRNIE